MDDRPTGGGRLDEGVERLAGCVGQDREANPSRALTANLDRDPAERLLAPLAPAPLPLEAVKRSLASGGFTLISCLAHEPETVAGRLVVVPIKNLTIERRGQVSENHHAYLGWGLAHLLPWFAEYQVAEIDAAAVDAYRTHKVGEAELLAREIERGRPKRDERGRLRRPLGAASINKTLEVLQWVLGYAVEYGHMPDHRNPAEGRRRRLPPPRRRPVHLDAAEQIEALLEAAAELDRRATCHCTDRRAIIATLVFAGPRAEELCNLLWRDVDLANGRISIGRSKTQAGLREIALAPLLRDLLAAHKAAASEPGPAALVFPTLTGARRDPNNLRNRVLAKALERAEEILSERGQAPLPPGVSPHKLRHTFASVLIATGEDPAAVMAQLGHTDPKFTLKVYTHMMRRGPDERARLKALVAGEAIAAEAPDSVAREAA